MFSFRPAEKVIPIEGFPQSSVGAPCPALVSTEHSLVVLFYLQQSDPNSDGTTVRIVDVESEEEPIALVTFERPSVHTFGPPNDEAFSGHRLVSKGLRPYGAYEVINSAWIEQLERMNAVHPRHDRTRFLAGKRHFILTFHDSTFECIAKGFQIDCRYGSIKQILHTQIESLDA